MQFNKSIKQSKTIKHSNDNKRKVVDYVREIRYSQDIAVVALSTHEPNPGYFKVKSLS